MIEALLEDLSLKELLVADSDLAEYSSNLLGLSLEDTRALIERVAEMGLEKLLSGELPGKKEILWKDQKIH